MTQTLLTIRYVDGSHWEGAFSSKPAALTAMRGLAGAGFRCVDGFDVEPVPVLATCDECGHVGILNETVGTFTVREGHGVAGSTARVCLGYAGSCMDSWVTPDMFTELWADYASSV